MTTAAGIDKCNSEIYWKETAVAGGPRREWAAVPDFK